MFIILRCGLMWWTLQGSCNVRMFWWEQGRSPPLCLFGLLYFGGFFRRQQWLEAFSSLGEFFVPSCFRSPVATTRKEGCWEAAVSDVFSAFKYKGAQSELLRGARNTFNSIESCAVRAVTLLSPKQRHCRQPALNKKTTSHSSLCFTALGVASGRSSAHPPSSLAAALGALEDRLTSKALAV